MAEKEEKRKKEYEQKNKTYRQDGPNVSYSSLADSPEGKADQDSSNEDSSSSEEERKARNEKMKKEAREKQNKKEEMKEKAAETVGASFGLPPFLSRFIADHPVFVTVLVVGTILLFVVLVTALIITITQHPFKFGLKMAKSIFKASWNLFREVALPEAIQ